MLINKKAFSIDEVIGKTVGNYKITEEIGSGGMSKVYKAIHLTLNRVVAVKMIHPNLVCDLRVIKRFYKEAKTQARLSHPNIVSIYDFLETEGNYFIIMEYVHGESLGKIVSEQGPFEPYIALSIFRQMLTGIRYAHSKGVIHRDIKPSNFILTPSGVKITDFGIAQITGDTGLTAAGATLGTPKYMSPEQILGERTDHRTDIYSLGVTFYEILTGRVPFNSDSDSEYEIKRGHVQLQPPLPTQIRPDIPRELDNIVLKALSKKPEDRFQSVNEFVMALESIYERKGKVITNKADPLNLANIHLMERSGGTVESFENLAPQEEEFDEKGDLSNTPYPILLLSLHHEKRTGFLVLDSWTKLKIYFLEGFLVFAEGGDPPLALGEMLVNRGQITRAEQENALSFALEAGLKIGETLIKTRKITPYELNSILETQTREKLALGFQCTSGFYGFKNTKDFIEKAMYKIHPVRVIYEGANRFIGKGEILKLLYERNSPIISSPDFEEEVKNLGFSYKELEFVEVLRKGITLEEAILKSPLGIDDTLKLLYSLNLIGLVDIQSGSLEFNVEKQVEESSASISEKTEVVDVLKTNKLEQADTKTPLREYGFQETLKNFFRRLDPPKSIELKRKVKHGSNIKSG